MSIYYSPELVRLLMAERLDEARRAGAIHCCQDPVGPVAIAPTGIADRVRTLFRRRSPAACTC
jgi:hypothetical protein